MAPAVQILTVSGALNLPSFYRGTDRQAVAELGTEVTALIQMACELFTEEAGLPPQGGQEAFPIALAAFYYGWLRERYAERDAARDLEAPAREISERNRDVNALARETWDALEVKPLGRNAFMAWRARIVEALDAGASPDLIRAAAVHAGGATQAMWDRALNIVRAAPPASKSQERDDSIKRALMARESARHSNGRQ